MKLPNEIYYCCLKLRSLGFKLSHDVNISDIPTKPVPLCSVWKAMVSDSGCAHGFGLAGLFEDIIYSWAGIPFKNNWHAHMSYLCWKAIIWVDNELSGAIFLAMSDILMAWHLSQWHLANYASSLSYWGGIPRCQLFACIFLQHWWPKFHFPGIISCLFSLTSYNFLYLETIAQADK